MYNKFWDSLLIFALILFGSCTQASEPIVAEFDNPASPTGQLPFLYSDNIGTLYLSWVEEASKEGEYRLLYSKLLDNGWTDPGVVRRSNEWFVNWADFPSVIAYNGEPVASHQLHKIPGNAYSYVVDISVNSSDGWSEPFNPHFDSTATEHGFVSMNPLDDQKFMAVWLDGRQTANRSDSEYFDLDKAMSLRSAIIHKQDGTVSERKLIDDTVCDCCPTSMVITEEGPVVAYRNRTEEEIRDIFISRYVDGSWTSPVAVHNDNWKIGACPVNGPRLSAHGSSLGVAWYTAGEGEPTVKAAYSSDYGESFEEPVVISRGNTLGRVDMVMSRDKEAYLSEIAQRGEKYYLTVHKISFDSRKIKSFEIASMSSSRSSGFPQMELRGDQLIFAWTEVKEDSVVGIKTARLSNL